jgi:hypothetical protein
MLSEQAQCQALHNVLDPMGWEGRYIRKVLERLNTMGFHIAKIEPDAENVERKPWRAVELQLKLKESMTRITEGRSFEAALLSANDFLWYMQALVMDLESLANERGGK